LFILAHDYCDVFTYICTQHSNRRQRFQSGYGYIKQDVCAAYDEERRDYDNCEASLRPQASGTPKVRHLRLLVAFNTSTSTCLQVSLATSLEDDRYEESSHPGYHYLASTSENVYPDYQHQTTERSTLHPIGNTRMCARQTVNCPDDIL
jgi:hypothetical protein